MRIDVLQRVNGGLQLWPSHVIGIVDDLALQIGEVNDVEVDDSQRSYSRGGQVHSQRRTQPSSADTEHARGLELLLAIQRDLRHYDVPAVAEQLFFRKLCASGRWWSGFQSDSTRY